MKQSLKRKQVTFTFKQDPGKEVFIAGSFNNWDQKRDKLTEMDQPGIYSISLMIARGRHEYKFVVDDIWQVDAVNPESVVNDLGSLNSVVVI
jgi:1,4-alpha-glucan branching enzyme